MSRHDTKQVNYDEKIGRVHAKNFLAQADKFLKSRGLDPREKNWRAQRAKHFEKLKETP